MSRLLEMLLFGLMASLPVVTMSGSPQHRRTPVAMHRATPAWVDLLWKAAAVLICGLISTASGTRTVFLFGIKVKQSVVTTLKIIKPKLEERTLVTGSKLSIQSITG